LIAWFSSRIDPRTERSASTLWGRFFSRVISVAIAARERRAGAPPKNQDRLSAGNGL
jgi:hypothetical protein